jgi:hypothetical protein
MSVHEEEEEESSSRPKYISLLAINSRSGILNSSRRPRDQDKNKDKDKDRDRDRSGKSSSSSSWRREEVEEARSLSRRNHARFSFNDEETESDKLQRQTAAPSPAPGLGPGLGLGQGQGELQRRPHTTGQLQLPQSEGLPQSPQGRGGGGGGGGEELDMGSSRDKERDTWRPSSPKVRISRHNQDLQLLWEQQQAAQQLHEAGKLRSLLALTAVLEEKLMRVQQERDRALMTARSSETKRDKAEQLCQLKLRESALLLQV